MRDIITTLFITALTNYVLPSDKFPNAAFHRRNENRHPQVRFGDAHTVTHISARNLAEIKLLGVQIYVCYEFAPAITSGRRHGWRSSQFKRN